MPKPSMATVTTRIPPQGGRKKDPHNHNWQAGIEVSRLAPPLRVKLVKLSSTS